ncbi:LacI family DNA-binding transcriptional regulator [Bordetella genomosp. 13]|uniref:LacI family DNA-binding transcriptional regulator n=1 Tax=Bordetella genomosp. 13 TaxID=463040 RepID=UPI0011A39FE3|nr:LacI family DNA-binding transcriptional regulator [Bordetella genomosp. 13]
MPSDKSARSSPRASVTVRDVARAAGVSMITVSRVINTPQHVSPSTLEKVNAAIRALGYVPNLMAGGLRLSRSNLVMVLVPTVAGSLFGGMLTALTRSLEAKGFQLMVGQSGYDAPREDALLRAIIGRRPDGIVLTGVMHSEQGRALLKASGIPIVETWDTTDTPIDMLLSLSHDDIGAAVSRYLHESGKTRQAVLCGDDERAHRRAQSFARTAVQLGLPEPVIHYLPAPTTHAQGREGLRRLQQGEGIDSVFCTSDLMASGVITEALAQGLRVPEDLSVVGFGDMEFAASMLPSITSVHVDGAAIGAQAAQMIAARVNGEAPPQAVVRIGFEIVRRDSA